jgi:hypothetical protein
MEGACFAPGRWTPSALSQSQSACSRAEAAYLDFCKINFRKITSISFLGSSARRLNFLARNAAVGA